MSDLPQLIDAIQAEVGAVRDRKFGVVTAGLVLEALRARHADPDPGNSPAPRSTDEVLFDERTEKVLATLDPKAVPMFRKFLCLARATAASMGCNYILISGNRTYAEQDAIYAEGRTAPGEVRTKARGGYSNHNFAIAADAAVFDGARYLDKVDPARAAKVHRACSEAAEECGLSWGGNWKSIVDQPHYEVATELSMADKRRLLKQKGSVL